MIDDQEVVNYMGRLFYKIKLGEETQSQVMEHFNVLAAFGVSVSVTGLDYFFFTYSCPASHFTEAR